MLSHTDMSESSASTNTHQCLGICCFTVLFCYWYSGIFFSPILLIPSNSSSSKTQFRYQFLQKAHSSIIFPYTDYVVTSLIHDVTWFCICRYCLTLYLSIYHSTLSYYISGGNLLYFICIATSKVFGMWHTCNKHFWKKGRNCIKFFTSFHHTISFDSQNKICCCCSVTKSCSTLCDPMDHSTLGSSVLHYLLEFV